MNFYFMWEWSQRPANVNWHLHIFAVALNCWRAICNWNAYQIHNKNHLFCWQNPSGGCRSLLCFISFTERPNFLRVKSSAHTDRRVDYCPQKEPLRRALPIFFYLSEFSTNLLLVFHAGFFNDFHLIESKFWFCKRFPWTPSTPIKPRICLDSLKIWMEEGKESFSCILRWP